MIINYMNYNDSIIKFCEKKLYPNQPEYLNAYSALYLSLISLYNLPQYKAYNGITLIYSNIFINGIGSFLYHWYGWYIFKLLDETTMIMAIWISISELLINLDYPIFYNILYYQFNNIFLILNTFMWFDNIFPIVFGGEVLLLIPLYFQSIKKIKDKNYDGIKGIIICSSAGIVWTITEKHCNKNLILGHPFWHISMGLGINYLTKYFKLLVKPANLII